MRCLGAPDVPVIAALIDGGVEPLALDQVTAVGVVAGQIWLLCPASAYPALVSRVEPKKELVVRCECGFEIRGTEDQIVPALQKHAGESHNMKVTRDQVLARAQPI